MPFKSEAQRRKFHAMAGRGEISEAKVSQWEHETPRKRSLPYHVSDNPGRKRVTRSKRKTWKRKARRAGRTVGRSLENLVTDPVAMGLMVFLVSAMMTAPSRQRLALPPQLRT